MTEPSHHRALAAYALSGFISLGYQVVWFRVFTDYFGATAWSFLTVLVSFIGALGAGAIASPHVERFIGARFGYRHLRAYGAIELSVAVSVAAGALIIMAVPAIVSALFPEPYVDSVAGEIAIFRPHASYAAAVIAVGVFAVVLPSFLMGITFPLVCGTFASKRRFPSQLYAANTAGAATGVLGAQFLGLPLLGHTAWLWSLVGVNAALGLVFFKAGHGHPASVTPPSAPLSSPDGRQRLLLALAAGGLAGALQGDLSKRLWFLGSTSSASLAFIAFWAIVAIATAAWVVHRWKPRPGLIASLLVAGALWYLALWQAAYPLRGWLVERLTASLQLPSAFAELAASVSLALQPEYAFLWSGLFAFVPLFCIGLILPSLCDGAAGDGKLIARIYGVNTVGFCAGVVAFVWAAPSVNVFYSLNLFSAVLVILVLYVGISVLPRAETWRVQAGLLGILVVAISTTVVGTPRGVDRDLLDPTKRAHHLPIRALKSNGAHTTFIAEDPEGDRLYFDSHPMSGTTRGAQTYMRLLAHAPLLFRPSGTRALVIGYGVGNTAAAALAHPGLANLDIVELNDKVIETAPEFRHVNGAVYDDSRVRFFHDDGRRFLRITDGRYDLITSEPPPPAQEGMFRLYSVDYYQAAAARLTERGVVSQWLPVAQLPNGAVDRMISSFVSVFPYAVLMVGQSRDLLLLGSFAPFDPAALRRNFDRTPTVARDLARIGIATPAHLLARLVSTDEALRTRYGHAPTVRDRRNDLSYLRFRPAEPLGIPFAPPTRVARSGGTSEELALRQYLVRSFPFDVFALPLPPPAQQRWAQASLLQFDYRLAKSRQNAQAAAKVLAEVDELGIDSPYWALERIGNDVRIGNLGQAYERLVRLKDTLGPQPGLQRTTVALLNGLGRHTEALHEVRTIKAALQASLRDHTPALLTLEGDALAGLNRPLDALAAYAAALALNKRYPPALRKHARLRQELSGTRILRRGKRPPASPVDPDSPR